METLEDLVKRAEALHEKRSRADWMSKLPKEVTDYLFDMSGVIADLINRAEYLHEKTRDTECGHVFIRSDSGTVVEIHRCILPKNHRDLGAHHRDSSEYHWGDGICNPLIERVECRLHRYHSGPHMSEEQAMEILNG